MAIRSCTPSPLPPLKFRTAGFPQYGFKPAIRWQPSSTHADLYAAKVQASSVHSSPTGASAATCGLGSPVAQDQSGPEALRSPAGYVVPPAQSLLRPHPRPSNPSAGLCIIRPTFCPDESGRMRGIPRFTPRVPLSVPSPVPRRNHRTGLLQSSDHTGLGRIRMAARLPEVHASRFTRGRVTRLQSSLDVAARTVAGPSSTRAFTFELSSQESPHWNVEYNYAGKQPISRDRTCTGWTRSITGCERMTRINSEVTELMIYPRYPRNPR